MYPIEHININKIIDGYKEGRQFRPLQFGDLMYIYCYDLEGVAQKYGVNPKDYGLTYERIHEYLYKHSECEIEYENSIMIDGIRHDTIRSFLFCSALSIPISLFICFLLYILVERYTLLLIFPLFILFFHLSYKYLYPHFYKWFYNKQEVKFLKKKGISYDKEIYEFINEILFQAFVKNRDPLKAHWG